ncbi:MAG TPA: hypothetical protein PLV51_05460, partial [Lentimicrobium sp.]|nr:hypothetical protein [Lentimicrobium sp.]
MRTLLLFVAASALFVSACTTQYQARNTYDDLYYSPGDAVATQQVTTVSPAVPETRYADAETQVQYYDSQFVLKQKTAYEINYQTESYNYQTSEQYTDPYT